MKRRFKKPKLPLYYLTFRGRAFIATFKVAILLHRILINISDICIYLGTKSCHFMSWFSICSVHQAYLYYIAYLAIGEAIDQVTQGCFDTDSFEIGVDTQCSRTMSGDKQHFNNLRESSPEYQHPIDGIGGNLAVQGIGTFIFNVQDDAGCISTIKLPNSLYVPGIKMLLLCPQHWYQSTNDHVSKPEGTFIMNYDKACT